MLHMGPSGRYVTCVIFNCCKLSESTLSLPGRREVSLVIMISKTLYKYEILESTSLIWSWVGGETDISVYSEDLAQC